MKQLSIPTMHILIALAAKSRHGYEIMQAVASETDGAITLGPGTLYGAIKRLLEDGLIEACGERATDDGSDERRRYYQLTAVGRQVLANETDQLEHVVRTARGALQHWGTTAAWPAN